MCIKSRAKCDTLKKRAYLFIGLFWGVHGWFHAPLALLQRFLAVLFFLL